MIQPRLLKVLVQAIYVAEVDGEMQEFASQPATLTPKQWLATDVKAMIEQGALALGESLAPAPAPASVPHSATGKDQRQGVPIMAVMSTKITPG